MQEPTTRPMATGVDGLDEVLLGGLQRRRVYLVEGRPGAGKTTLALQWMMEGVASGERCLHISLSETTEELRASMESHGWSADHENLVIAAMNLVPADVQRDPQYTLYHPAEVELGETIERILAEVDRVEPDRVVIDSLSEVRLMSQDPLRYRRQLLTLKQVLAARGRTTLLVSSDLAEPHQAGLHSLVHGVIKLEQTTMGFGANRRQLEVIKMRGRPYHEGVHSFTIRRGGLRVFPPLTPEDRAPVERAPLPSGKQGLDVLLGGGLTRGTSTLFMGPTGSGKSMVMAQYVAAALERGQGAVVFAFDERRDLFLDRAAGMGLRLDPHLESGLLSVRQVDPGQLSPGEFASWIRTAAEDEGRELVVVDSLNGFLSSMPEERFLLIHLHEVLDYLGSRAVTSILTMTQPGILRSDATSVNASYLADAIVLFRYFEARGEVMKAVSVLKKRLGGHERAIRELRIDATGIEVGEPLTEFRGILSGVPVLHEKPTHAAEHDER